MIIVARAAKPIFAWLQKCCSANARFGGRAWRQIHHGENRSRLGKGLSALIGEVEGVSVLAAPDEAVALEIRRPGWHPSQNLRCFRHSSEPSSAAAAHFLRPSLKNLRRQSSNGGFCNPSCSDPTRTRRINIKLWRANAAGGRLSGQVSEPYRPSSGTWMSCNFSKSASSRMFSVKTSIRLRKRKPMVRLLNGFGRTQENLAESVGKSRAHIANTMRLLNLGESAREHLRQGPNFRRVMPVRRIRRAGSRPCRRDGGGQSGCPCAKSKLW